MIPNFAISIVALAFWQWNKQNDTKHDSVIMDDGIMLVVHFLALKQWSKSLTKAHNNIYCDIHTYTNIQYELSLEKI